MANPSLTKSHDISTGKMAVFTIDLAEGWGGGPISLECLGYTSGSVQTVGINGATGTTLGVVQSNLKNSNTAAALTTVAAIDGFAVITALSAQYVLVDLASAGYGTTGSVQIIITVKR